MIAAIPKLANLIKTFIISPSVVQVLLQPGQRFDLCDYNGNRIIRYTDGGELEMFVGDANLILHNLIEGDPAVQGQLYNAAGTVKISGG